LEKTCSYHYYKLFKVSERQKMRCIRNESSYKSFQFGACLCYVIYFDIIETDGAYAYAYTQFVNGLRTN